MSKFCLGTLLTAINKCAIKRGFVQSRVYAEMFKNLGDQGYIEPSLIGHIVRGAKNPPSQLLDSINDMDPKEYSNIVDCFDCVSSRIDANKIDLFGKIIKKIADGDDEINDETVVDLVNGTKKKDLPGNLDDLSSFIAGVYIYVIKYTDNRGQTESVKEIDDLFIARIIAESTSNDPKNTEIHKDEIGEEDELTARKFLIEHESEKELIPLCQVAFLSNPNHKHIRPMYNEFLVLPSKVRKIILDTCEQVATIQVLHTNEALDLFCKDLEEYGLSSKRYLYMFNQYLYRAFSRYSACSIEHYNIYTFERLNKSVYFAFEASKWTSLSGYIDEYLWMKEREGGVEVEVPMDYLVDKKGLTDCEEEDLTLWLCRFVIDACANLYHRIDKDRQDCCLIDDHEAQNQEDLYYCALLALNNLYTCHQNKV